MKKIGIKMRSRLYLIPDHRQETVLFLIIDTDEDYQLYNFKNYKIV